MDTLRGTFGPLDALDLDGFAIESEEESPADDDATDAAPPPSIGTDERRMQVRAYNFWASLLEDRNFPSIEDVDPTLLPDFGPYSVLLDFSSGIENPSINYLGDQLAKECRTASGALPENLSDVPPRSLLSRITDHYMQILANQSPIGFEAEFTSSAGQTILYRGILLPFSSDDETIDFIYGVINWKEMADASSADALLLEIDQALEVDASASTAEEAGGEPYDALTDWADGPVTFLESAAEPPRPSFDLSGQQGAGEVDEEVPAEPQATAPETGFSETREDETAAAAPAIALADWLAAAREMAQEAKSSEERTRAALYEAVGRAWDFALAAQQAPDEFAQLLDDAQIATQERAPMTPVVKLVFGADYDKTRITEYAAVLSFALRKDIGQGELGDFLKNAEGGLKAVVADERAFRRGVEGAARLPRTQPRKSIAKKLRKLAPQALASVPAGGSEFGLVMIHRTDDGEVVMLGEISDDASLIEKAARKLIG